MESEPPDPQDSSVNQPPPPPGYVSVLINPRPTMDQIRLDPQDKLTPPPTHPPGQDWSESSRHPSDTLPTKHPPSTGQQKCLRPTHP